MNNNKNNNTRIIANHSLFYLLWSFLLIANKTAYGLYHPRNYQINNSSQQHYIILKDRHFLSNASSIFLPFLRGGAVENDMMNGVKSKQTVNTVNPRIGMWEKCISIVILYITTGTIFYHKINKWSISTAYFYAVDAGMSIGFCVNGIGETTVASRAFSILFILVGASVVAGALALFVEDVLEGASKAIRGEYRVMLEEDSFQRYDKDGDGVIRREEMVDLLESVVGVGSGDDEGVSKRDKLKAIYDELLESKSQVTGEKADNDGITMGDFVGFFREIEHSMGDSSNSTSKGVEWWQQKRKKKRVGMIGRFFYLFQEGGTHTLLIVMVLYITLGILWGMTNQKWDPITSAHFAVSALATGGLTAPPVDESGTLPTNVAIFVGTYCLFGIPLFYCSMGHFAKVLVNVHLTNVERLIINTPLKPYEYDLVARSLCTPNDEYVHLSDFIVMHFLRRGTTDLDIVRLVKNQFEALDLDGDGALTFEEATSGLERFYTGD